MHVPYRRSATVIALAALLVLGLAGGVVASDQFRDVGDSHVFHDEIGWMGSTGVSQGYPDGTYRPDVDVTRGAMSAFMARLAGADPDVAPVVDAATVQGLSASELQGEPAVHDRATITYRQAASDTPGSRYDELRELGRFSKQEADSVVRLHLTSHASVPGDDTCSFQLRVDGVHSAGDTSGSAGNEAIVGGAEYSPYTIEALFDGLEAGTHTVSLWTRVVSGGQCVDNPGNFLRTFTVEELPAS